VTAGGDAAVTAGERLGSKAKATLKTRRTDRFQTTTPTATVTTAGSTTTTSTTTTTVTPI
jgi:hypothetical protein